MAGIGIENLESFNTLVFGSLEFLFWYLPVFLVLYAIVPEKYKSYVLFVCSIILYGAGDVRYVLLLLGMTVVNYLFGRSMEEKPVISEFMRNKWENRRKKKWFIAAVCCNVILLLFFKVVNAFDESWLLPVGISFYTFKSLSYLIDVYRLEADAEHSFARFGAYLCMFPQIVSGPIMRYNDALKGLRFGMMSLGGVEEGLKKVVLGLCGKVLIADRLGILWNDIQMIGFESISTPLAWLGMISYSLQLYFDFAGYSLIAIGICEMIDLPVIQNFDQPYSSRSVSEFYRKWHMTLGSWFKDYVYIPLGGNRRGDGRTVLNLLIVWVLTGFWHGGSVNFVIWGLILGLLIVLEKLWLGKYLAKFKILSHIYVLLVIPLTWVVFAITSLPDLGMYFSRLFPFFGTGTAVNDGDFAKELGIFAPTLVLAVFCCIPAVGRWYEKHRRNAGVIILLAVLFWIAVYQMANAGNNPFMYANF